MIGVVTGGYFAYDHFSGPSVDDIEASTKASIELKWLTTDSEFLRNATITELELVKESENKYTGYLVVRFRDGDTLQPDLEVTVDGDDLLWKIDLD